MGSLRGYLFPLAHRALIGQFVKRDLQARYRQSVLGLFWAVLNPLLMLGVYTFVFRIIFKLRWAGVSTESDLSFALRLYAGLAVFNFFAECINRAPRLILDQANLVKKVVFPLEILAWINTLSAMLHLGIALVLLLLFSAWEQGGLPITVWALPLVWLPLLPLCVGLGWFFSALGTYIRDVGQALGMLISLLMFLSPIFFGMDAVPEIVKPWMFLNPLALTITQTREVLLDGQWPDFGALGLHFLACMVIAVVGAVFFKLARKGFSDVV